MRYQKAGISQSVHRLWKIFSKSMHLCLSDSSYWSIFFWGTGQDQIRVAFLSSSGLNWILSRELGRNPEETPNKLFLIMQPFECEKANPFSTHFNFFLKNLPQPVNRLWNVRMQKLDIWRKERQTSYSKVILGRKLSFAFAVQSFE